jgi:hypothetical protein
MPGMEYVLGAGVCTFALFGALTVSDVLSPLVIFIVLFVRIALMPFLTGEVSMFLYDFPIPIICFSILSTLIIYTQWKMLSTPLSERAKMIRYAGMLEILTYFLLPVVLMSYLTENINIFAPILLIVVPPLWVKFYVKVFFGKRMPLE